MKRFLSYLSKPLLVEFLGTFFLVLTIAMTNNPVAIASMLMAWLYIGANESGANYNPLISLALAITNHLSWKKFGLYSLSQIFGGFMAFVFTYNLKGIILVPQPSLQFKIEQAFLIELLLSLVFALVVLYTAVSKNYKNSYVFGFAIAFTVPALAALGAPISGGLFNPAISIGANLFALSKGMSIIGSHLLMYIAGSFGGGALAAYLYKFIEKE